MGPPCHSLLQVRDTYRKQAHYNTLTCRKTCVVLFLHLHKDTSKTQGKVI